MAGILDSKTRIVDFILTDEGRRQVRSGDLRISFASFSDLGTFYTPDESGAAEDASRRIYFEASSRYQDRIVVESKLGIISDFSTAGPSGSYDLSSEQIATQPESPTSANEQLYLTGSQVIEDADALLQSITQNFIDNQLIAKRDVFSYKQGFEVSDEEIEFRPTYELPIDTWLYTTTAGVFRPPTLSSFDSITFDRRFAHFPNFKFLPPINKKTAGSSASGRPLGRYANLNQPEILTRDKLKTELKGLQHHEIRFDPTSRENSIMIQPFEFNSLDGTVKKLSIIDFGVFPNDMGTSAGVHVFFVGKIFRSRDGSLKFFNIFTLELDV